MFLQLDTKQSKLLNDSSPSASVPQNDLKPTGSKSSNSKPKRSKSSKDKEEICIDTFLTNCKDDEFINVSNIDSKQQFYYNMVAFNQELNTHKILDGLNLHNTNKEQIDTLNSKLQRKIQKKMLETDHINQDKLIGISGFQWNGRKLDYSEVLSLRDPEIDRILMIDDDAFDE